MSLIIGLVLGIGLAIMVLFLTRLKIKFRWYEAVIGVIGLFLTIWAVHDSFAARAEYNDIAAGIFLWLFGVPGILLLGLAIFLAWWRNIRRSRNENRPAEKMSADPN